MRGDGWRRWGQAAAMLAVALLSLATVRSQVMRAAELSSAPAVICMAGMVMPAPAAAGKASNAAHRSCEFCAAASHAPVLADPLAPPVPGACAARTPYLAHASLGPRGPPAVSPHARGPPVLLRA